MRQKSVWREPGMPALIGMVSAGFAGYALLMPIAPLWAAHGGADEAGVGAVTGVFMLFTVLVQMFVPAAIRRSASRREQTPASLRYLFSRSPPAGFPFVNECSDAPFSLIPAPVPFCPCILPHSEIGNNTFGKKKGDCRNLRKSPGFL